MAKLIEITGKALSGEWGLEDESKTGIPVLRTTNFTNFGIINYGDVVTRNITKKNISEKFLRKGDIIIEKSGGSDKQPVGRVVLFNGEENRFLFNNFTSVLRVKDREKWVPEYVFYALFVNYRNGGTRKYENKTTGLHNLKTDLYINNYEIEWVNIAEQKNVCTTLRKIESIISDMNKEIDYLDELIKARFVEMFGDINNKQVKIAELVEQKIPTAKKDFDGDAEIKYIDISSIDNKRNIMTGFTKHKMSNAPSRAQQHVQFGDIIISTVRPNLKNVAMISLDSNNLVASSGFCVLRPKKCTPEFLMAIVCSDKFTDAMINVVTGANYPAIKNSDVLNYCVSLPSKEQQSQFSNFVAQVDKSKFALSNELAMGNFYIRLIHDCIMHGCIDL